jgi:Ser/Thr protein kinase RdoA (MazF antagonist)
MDNTYFPIRYSQLDPKALKEELNQRYVFDEKVSCRLFDYGLNDIYQVKSENIVYYLRVSLAGVHNRKDYEEEIFIINTLSKNNISVAAPIKCNDGQYIWEINAPEGKRYAVLFEEAKKLPSDNSKLKSHNLGIMLAKLHEAADNNDFTVSRKPIDLIQLAEEPLEAIYPFLNHRQVDYDFIKTAAKELCAYIKEKLRLEKPYYGYCHGDIHSGNVFFDGDNPKIFDFDCMGYGWRAYDICVYAWNETGGDESYIEKEPWNAFLEGYNSIRRLSETELEAINAFAALRELWLMGLHADVIERNAGSCWYNDDYFDFRLKLFKLWYNRFASKLR